MSLRNRIGVDTGTAGTGLLTLGAGLPAGSFPYSGGWKTFAEAGVTEGQVVRYLILDANGAWEYGLGTYSEAVGVTLDPLSVTNVTLSGGNLTATNTATTSADQGAKVANSSEKATGKYYIECKLTTFAPSGGANRGFGIGKTGSTYTTMGNSGTVGDMCYFSSGGIWANGVNTAITGTVGGLVQGEFLGCAVDLDNRKIWFREWSSTLGTSVWNNNAANDPVTNVGGINIPSGIMVPYLTFGGSVGVAGNAHTVNFGGSGFASTPPAGYTAGWPAGPSTAPVRAWNPGDRNNMTLSNGDLTATCSAAASGVRGNVGKSTGKHYWEILGSGSSFVGMGLALSTAAQNLLSPPGSVVVNNGGLIFVNGGSSIGSIGSAIGNTVGVAVDLTNKLIWFRNSATGLWNGNAANNPATGVGGIDISPVATGFLYPYFGTNTATGGTVTVNFGASALVGAVPAGFTSGWLGN